MTDTIICKTDQDVDVELSIYRLAKRLSTEQLADLLDEWVNCSIGSPYSNGVAMGRQFQRTHRTLQGSLVNLCLGILSGLGETDIRYTDARNEKAIELAQQVRKLVEQDGLQPFI